MLHATKRSQLRLILLAAIAVSIGGFTSFLGTAQSANLHDAPPVNRVLCGTTIGALDGIGADLKVDAQIHQECRNQVAAVDAPGFNPGYHIETASVDNNASLTEPPLSVTVVVVPPRSRGYALAAETDFIVDSRYYCDGDNCWPSAYEVYVTTQEVGSGRVDELVALAFGVPRDPCNSLDWIRLAAGCGN